VSRPPIIPRSAWGAATVPPRAAPAYGIVQAAFVHHTVTTNSYSPAQSAAIVLGIARYHRDSNGWNDIGYNFLVDRYGQVFEGRAGGIEAAVVGAQAQGYNAQSTGIACIGTFSSVGQTAAGMQALARLIGWKLSVHAVPTQGAVTLISAGGPYNRYPSGTRVTVRRICGHRDGDATSCPGGALYGQLGALRTRAARYAGPVQGVTLRGDSVQRGPAPVALAGTLRFADGASAAGAIVSAEYSPDGAAWTPLASARCARDGAWTASAALPASGQVRAVFAGDATHGRLASGPIGIVVVPTLRLSLDHRRLPVGGALGIRGSIAPPAPAVTLVVERRSGGRWVRVARKRVRARDGAFATTVRLRRRGLHRVSAVAVGVARRRTVRAIP
jgi:hypothetical protein